MALGGLDCCLLCATVVIVITDIILALCLKFVLPKHITHTGWYPADGKEYSLIEAVEICPCLIRIFPEDIKEKIAFIKIPKTLVQKRAVDDVMLQHMDKYPYLVSLSIPAYSDDPEQMMFACNGVILSTEKLLTTENCVKDKLEWQNLTVRSASPHWSKYGQTHSVTGVLSTGYDKFVEIKVSPEFSKSLVPNPPIKYPFFGNWTYAVSLGWNEHMYKQSLDYRYKHNFFDHQEWTSVAYAADYTTIFYKSTSCERSSRPLVTSCYQLLGTVLDGKRGCEGFLAFNVSENNDKALASSRLIYKDTGVIKDIEICKN